MAETKNEAFKRISTSRLEKATKSISLLQNLMSNNYESTIPEREAIIESLMDEVEALADIYGVEMRISNETPSAQTTNDGSDKDEETPEEVLSDDDVEFADKRKKKPTVLKVVRDLEFGEMPLFASSLQQALTQFAKKEAGSDKHLRQLLRISALAASDNK